MVTRELLEYVRIQISQGADRALVAANLATQGWNPADVAEAFKTLDAAVAPTPTPAPAPVPQAPVPASFVMPTAAPVVASAAAVPAMGAFMPPAAAQPAQPQIFIGFAGFWLRGCALIIDGLLLQIITVLAAFLAIVSDNVELAPVAPYVSMLVGAVYFILMESSSKQATLGKMAIGIKVVTIDGQRISLLRSVGRYASRLVEGLTVGIGLLMAAFTERKQTLHDMIAGTLVIKYRESHIGTILLSLFLAVVLIGGSLAAFTYYYVIPKIGDSFLGAFSTLGEAIKEGESGSSDEEPIVPMTAAEYDAAFATPIMGVEDEYRGDFAYAGPAYIAFDGFWLDAAVPVIPNVTVDEGVYVEINNVYAQDGKDANNAQSSFNTDVFFTSLKLMKLDNPVVHYKGTRSLHLLDGYDKSDVLSIVGSLEFRLPLADGGVYSKSYPFAIAAVPESEEEEVTQATETTPAPTPAPSVAPSNSEKEAIITGIMNTQTTLASGDATKIRAYLNKAYSSDAEALAELKATSDTEILNMADMMVSFSEGVTAAAMRAPSTVWTFQGDTSVKVKVTVGEGETMTVSATKVNGVWY